MGLLLKTGIVDQSTDIDVLIDFEEITTVSDGASLGYSIPGLAGIVSQMTFSEIDAILPLVLYSSSGTDSYVNAKQVAGVVQEDTASTPIVKVRLKDGSSVTCDVSLATMISRFKHVEGSVLT